MEGWHGTRLSNGERISKNGFVIQRKSRHYLGPGIYFFIKSNFGCPIEAAKKWAKLRAYDKRKDSYYYRKYCVVYAVIKEDAAKIFDLRKIEDKEKLYKFKQKYRDYLKHNTVQVEDTKLTDYFIFSEIIKNDKIDIIIKDEFVRFSYEIDNDIRSCIPNTVMVSITNVDIIQRDTINIVYRGKI